MYLISSFSMCMKAAGIDLEKNMHFHKRLIRIDFDDDLKSEKTSKFLNISTKSAGLRSTVYRGWGGQPSSKPQTLAGYLWNEN